MQKFTRQERIGIAAVAVISILICGAGMFLNRKSSDSREFIIEEKIFINDNDSATINEKSDEDIKESGTKRKGSGSKKGRKKGASTPKKKERKSAAPPRDFLNDEVKRHKE